MKTVVYTCPFVPAEWIAAHGLRPRRILPHAPAAGPMEGVCPYAWAFAQAVRSEARADAIVFTTTCDQMRRVADTLSPDDGPPCFLMHVPSTWQTTTAQKLYIAELERLGHFLVRLGGTAPSLEELADVMREHDARRATLRAAAGHLSARAYSETIARFHRDGVAETDAPASDRRTGQVPLALVGGPMLPSHFALFDVIERAGGTVALDATTSGERSLPAPFDRRALGEDPFLALVDAYFGGIPDAFRRPNSLLYQWLKRRIAEREIRGIVFRYYTWCDTWHAEEQRMKEWSPVPLLGLSAGADEQVDGHTVSRIESFLEMLG